MSQPSGVARLDAVGDELRLTGGERPASHQSVLAWIDEQAGKEPAMLPRNSRRLM
jgi:hypothetical protein